MCDYVYNFHIESESNFRTGYFFLFCFGGRFYQTMHTIIEANTQTHTYTHIHTHTHTHTHTPVYNVTYRLHHSLTEVQCIPFGFNVFFAVFFVFL